MCRWMAYSGSSVPLETLLFDVQRSLIDQSMSSRSATPTNGDGFGVGWYGSRPTPGVFRSIRPAWNDFNLRNIAAQVDARLFLAHVRAASLAAVQEVNCHPFRHGRWLFVHNGEIADFSRLRRDLLLAVDPALFPEVLGTTDSEVMFHLGLTFGLESDPLGALSRMAAFVERTGRAHGVKEPLTMTLGVSDGASIWAVRYASAGPAPTLYYSPSPESFRAMNPGAVDELGPHARAVVSEPIGQFAEAWIEIPQSSAIHVHDGEIDRMPFEVAR